MMMLPPVVTPMAILVTMFRIWPELLMAEIPALPINCPTMMVSTMLYRAWSRLVITMGMA